VSDDLREVEGRFFRLAVWSLVAALLSALLWFWLAVANMSGLSLASAFSATAWQTVLLETEFGRVWQLRLGLIAVAFALIASGLARDEARRARMFILWLLSVAFLVSLAWISHAAATRVQPLGLFGDALHLCAVGAWIGGLAPLAIFLARARVSLSLGERAVRVVERFSTLSLFCVSVLVVSGISNSWLLVGSIRSLFTTPYGRLLLSKLILFGILIGFGARNRFLVKTKLRQVPAVSDLLPQLRRNVICEACLGVAVVAIVACLGVTPPARHP
jgi:copper resistance protein D